MNECCRFIVHLAETLRQDPYREKRLLSPSHRVGRQWLDQAARLAGGFANVRPVTIKRLVLDFAEPILRRRGLRAASRPEMSRIIGQALGRIAGESGEKGYFANLPPSLDLAETLAASLNELETANVMSTTELSRRVTPPEKAAELAKLVGYCRASRMKEGLAGPGDIHAAAMEALAEAGADAPLLLLPEAMEDDFTAMDQAFVSRWPDGLRRLLAEDGDGLREIRTFTADSIINEIREVFRRIQAEALPLDSVEILCADPVGYVSALCAVGLETFGGRPEELPITFNSGLPGNQTRPGRLLDAWLEWIEQGLPAEGLARMIDSGLLPEDWRGCAPPVSAAALAARIRALPINGVPREYLENLRGTDGGALGAAETWLARLFERIVPLVGETPAPADSGLLLGAAENLLSLPSDHDARLDAYAKSALLDAIRVWRPLGDWPGFDPQTWLSELSANLRVMGLGPLPGRLHVGDLTNGGHSGRPNTFIVGMDDSRFPGVPRQDPVLLDRDRAGISPMLRKSGHRVRQREKSLVRLFARLRGKATVSHARLDAASGRELYPAAAFARLASGGAPGKDAVLTPDAADKCLCERDDWLHALLGRGTAAPEWTDIQDRFPDLARGRAAGEARESAAFTEYDGYVPEAGEECDPAGDRVFSPSDLETFAACPMDYFFKRVLRIAAPERYAPTPGRWLDGARRGELLHNLFQDFLDRLQQRGETLSDAPRERRLDLLCEMLEKSLARHRREFPPRDTLALFREAGEMKDAAEIFLLTEERRQADAEPLHREVRLGGSGKDRTPWDREAPVEARLRDGGRILLRGRIDRVDRLAEGGLLILDYKTGTSAKYEASKPFRQGRNLQPFLYIAMLEQALADLGRPEPVKRFAYFFPMPRDEGRIIAYERTDLADNGMEILKRLANMLARGCFPFTTNAEDVAYSEYAPIYGEARELAVRVKRKSESDPLLVDWMALREMDI